MRDKIVEAILREYRKQYPSRPDEPIRESLRHIVSDLSLVGLAQELGIDTDAVLAVRS